MDDDQFSEPLSPPSLKQQLQQSLCFSRCFPHRPPPPPPQQPPPPLRISTDRRQPALMWVQPEEESLDKCQIVFSVTANANVKHKRPSTKFRYGSVTHSTSKTDTKTTTPPPPRGTSPLDSRCLRSHRPLKRQLPLHEPFYPFGGGPG